MFLSVVIAASISLRVSSVPIPWADRKDGGALGCGCFPLAGTRKGDHGLSYAHELVLSKLADRIDT